MAEGDRQRRILVVSQHFWPENFRINDVVAGFTDAGLAVDVLCGLPNYPKGEWFEGYRYRGPRRQQHAGVEVFRAGEVRRKGNTSLRILLNYISFPFFALFNLPRLAGRKYDAVFCYETSPVLMLLPAIVYAKCHRLPLTGYVLDLWPENLYSVLPLKNRFLRAVAQKVSDWHYRRCTRLVALSEAQAERLREVTRGRKKEIDIAVIPQYSEDFYAADVADEALRGRFAGHFNILFAGNISPAQDLENLVAALRLALERRPEAPLQVLILGDGMSREALRERVVQAGLEANFIFCGQVAPEDVPHWTGMADALFAGLARSENLGLTVPAKIASYLAAGRPLLVAMDGEAARAAAESGAALVSAAGDAEALCGNILRLLDMDKAARDQMGEAGRRCWQQHYRRGPLLQRLQQFILDGTP